MASKGGTSPTNSSSLNAVQHDQIPQNAHSSASYKQELMDSSVLLDGINELLNVWDSDQKNTHSLNPFMFSSAISNAPLITTAPLNNTTSLSPRNKHHSHHSHKRHRSHSKESKRLKYKSKKHRDHRSNKNKSSNHDNNNKNHQKSPKRNDNNSSGYEQAPVYGLHQTYYRKSDNSDNKNKSKSGSQSPDSKRKQFNQSNLSNVEEIPMFLQQNKRRLDLLKEMVSIKRNELERVSQRHDYTLSCIIKLHIHAGEAIAKLRKQHRTLSLYAEQLSREGLLRNKTADLILNTLHNIEEQRKDLLNKIESPAWEIKHHFHILSFEHFRGNPQPHLLEIAEVLPSRLQIAAIAHNCVIKNDKLLSKFHRAQKERDLLYKKLSQIDKKRNLTQAHLKDYKKMMTIIKKNVGEKRLNKLRKDLEKKALAISNKPKQTQIVKTPPYLGVGGGVPPPHMRMNYVSPSNSPYLSPQMGGIGGVSPDRFRLQYLSGIGIRKAKKVGFNLIEFVKEINIFLSIELIETNQEVFELEDNSDLINPITGQVNNPSNATIITDNGNNEESKGDGSDANVRDANSEQESDVTMGNVSGSEGNMIGTDSSLMSEDGNTSGGFDGNMSGMNEEDGVKGSGKKKKKKLKPKVKHTLVMKEKAMKTNILNIIDRQKYKLNTDLLDENSKIVYTVSFIDEDDDGVAGGDEMKEFDDDLVNESDRKTQSKNLNAIMIIEKDGSGSSANTTGLKQHNNTKNDERVFDAPHRDWSVLAKHLKDSSKETARRKQILKQLERILHVREGLLLGFDQLTQIHNQFLNRKIVKK